jgi:hypothetical protein
VVGWFNELSELRGYEFTTKVEGNKRYRIPVPLRLQPSEIESWLRLQKLDATGFEADLLLRIDAAYVTGQRKRGGKPATAHVPVTDSAAVGALFRSMMPPGKKPPPVVRKR